jgi:four helix bundle protein
LFPLFSVSPFRFSVVMSRTTDELRGRTKKYASSIVRFYVDLPKHRPEVQVLGHQLLRSGTSIAANFREASRARTTAEFISKLETCIQEADESDLWLELLHDDCGIVGKTVENLLVETNELISIFVTIVKRTKDNPDL